MRRVFVLALLLVGNSSWTCSHPVGHQANWHSSPSYAEVPELDLTLGHSSYSSLPRQPLEQQHYFPASHAHSSSDSVDRLLQLPTTILSLSLSQGQGQGDHHQVEHQTTLPFDTAASASPRVLTRKKGRKGKEKETIVESFPTSPSSSSGEHPSVTSIQRTQSNHAKVGKPTVRVHRGGNQGVQIVNMEHLYAAYSNAYKRNNEIQRFREEEEAPAGPNKFKKLFEGVHEPVPQDVSPTHIWLPGYQTVHDRGQELMDIQHQQMRNLLTRNNNLREHVRRMIEERHGSMNQSRLHELLIKALKRGYEQGIYFHTDNRMKFHTQTNPKILNQKYRMKYNDNLWKGIISNLNVHQDHPST